MADVPLPLAPGELARIRAAGLMVPFQPLLDHINTLTLQIQDLKSRLGQNCSRPPSQDPPAAEPGGGKRKGGGQPGARPGHKGSHRELIPPDQVDAIVVRDPESCMKYGLGLRGGPRQRQKRWQITEQPEIRPTVIEFQLWEKFCPCCGARIWDRLPGDGPRSAFAPDLQATESLLSGAYHVSFFQVHNLLKDVFHLSMSIGSIQACRKVAPRASTTTCQPLLAETQATQVVHTDETGSSNATALAGGSG